MDGDSSAHVRYPQLLHATWWRCRHRGIRAFSRGAMQELDDELYMATNPTSYREQTKLVYRPCWYKLSFALYFSVKLWSTSPAFVSKCRLHSLLWLCTTQHQAVAWQLSCSSCQCLTYSGAEFGVEVAGVASLNPVTRLHPCTFKLLQV